MKKNLKLKSFVKTKSFSDIILFSFLLIILLLFINNLTHAQGLVNNGARIIINSNANVIVDGGAAMGNFTNQDLPASTGIVENAGVLSVTGNWTNNSLQNVFTANTGTVNLNGTTQTIAGSTSTYFNNLSCTFSGLKTLAVNTLVGGGFAASSGVLSLATSNLDLNTHTLTVNNPAATAITRLSGFIISETNAAFNPSIIQWNCLTNSGTYTFPFGSAHGYTPVVVSKGTSAGSSNISASTRSTAAANNLPWGSGVAHLNSPVIGGPGEVPVVIDRWYYVSASSPINVDLQFTYSGIENTTTFAPTGTFAAQNWTGLWQPPVGSGPGVLAGTATVSVTSQLIGPVNNNWVLTNILAPLPIQLLSFNANCEGENKVRISWQTASEVNVSNYNIERSSDGVHFQVIATIPVQNSVAPVKDYQWKDNNLLHSNAYYRLKENDINGQQTIFNTVTVNKCSDESDAVQIYATPGNFNFNINATANSQYQVYVFDIAGKLVLQNSQYLNAGRNSFQLSGEKLADGIYFVKVMSDDNVGLNQKIFLRK
ncbi:MAG: T9SS type A sorting domain-containing protein [Bacteroidia bacterium]